MQIGKFTIQPTAGRFWVQAQGDDGQVEGAFVDLEKFPPFIRVMLRSDAPPDRAIIDDCEKALSTFWKNYFYGKNTDRH